MIQPGRPKMTIWRMRIACRITKATNTYSGYVTPIYSERQKKKKGFANARTLPVLLLVPYPVNDDSFKYSFYNSAHCHRFMAVKIQLVGVTQSSLKYVKQHRMEGNTVD